MNFIFLIPSLLFLYVGLFSIGDGLQLLFSIGEFDLQHRRSFTFEPSFDDRRFGYKLTGGIEITDWLTIVLCLFGGILFTYMSITFFHLFVDSNSEK